MRPRKRVLAVGAQADAVARLCLLLHVHMLLPVPVTTLAELEAALAEPLRPSQGMAVIVERQCVLFADVASRCAEIPLVVFGPAGDTVHLGSPGRIVPAGDAFSARLIEALRQVTVRRRGPKQPVGGSYAIFRQSGAAA